MDKYNRNSPFTSSKQDLQIQLKSALDRIDVLEKQLKDRERKGTPTATVHVDVQQYIQKIQLAENETKVLKWDKQNLASQLKSSKEQNMTLKKKVTTLEEDCNIVKYQFNLFEEDFKNERSEKERAMKKVSSLERDLETTRTLLNQYSESQAQNAAAQRQASRQKIKDDYYRNQSYQVPAANRQQHTGFIGRGRVECDGEDSDDDDVIDSLQEPSYDDCSTSHDRMQNSNSLQCPKCNAGFDIDDHVAFIDHVDTCRCKNHK